MKDLLINYAFATLFHLLAETVNHASWKPALLKLFRILLRIFGQDTDFQNAIVESQSKAVGA